MATSRAFKTLLRIANDKRNAAHEFLSTVEALLSMINLAGGGDPEDGPDEEDVDRVRMLVADVQEFDLD